MKLFNPIVATTIISSAFILTENLIVYARGCHPDAAAEVYVRLRRQGASHRSAHEKAIQPNHNGTDECYFDMQKSFERYGMKYPTY